MTSPDKERKTELDDIALAHRAAYAAAEPDKWEQATVEDCQAALEANRDISKFDWLHYEITLAKRNRKMNPGKPFYRLKPASMRSRSLIGC